jgi:hypothetical protein
MATMTSHPHGGTPAEATVSSGAVERMVSITLSEADYQAIKNTKQDFGEVAQYLMEEFARGGAMVPSEKVVYLSDITNIPIYGSDDIVQIVENTAKRNSPGGQLRVVTDVDSAFAPALEDLAYAQGRTVSEILHEAVNIILTNAWLYAISTDGGTIPLAATQRERLESIIGKAPVTSDVLMEWAEHTSEPRHEPEPPLIVQVAPPKERKLSKLQKQIVEKMQGAAGAIS